MIKAVLLFLLVMVAIGMVANLIFPGSVKRSLGPTWRPTWRPAWRPKKPGKCPRCGRFLIGSKGCDCGKAG